MVKENVRGKDVYIIQPTCMPVNENLVELLLMVSERGYTSDRCEFPATHGSNARQAARTVRYIRCHTPLTDFQSSIAPQGTNWPWGNLVVKNFPPHVNACGVIFAVENSSSGIRFGGMVCYLMLCAVQNSSVRFGYSLLVYRLRRRSRVALGVSRLRPCITAPLVAEAWHCTAAACVYVFFFLSADRQG